MDQPQELSFADVVRRLSVVARPHLPHLGGILLLTMLAAPVALLLPLPVKLVVDSVIGDRPLPAVFQAVLPAGWIADWPGRLALAIVLLLAVTSFGAFITMFAWVLQSSTGERLVMEFRSRLFRHLQRLSLSYHDRHGVSDATFRIQFDAPAIQWLLVDGFVPLASAVITIVGMICVTATLNWQIALVALAICPVLMALSRRSNRKLLNQWMIVKDVQSEAMSVLTETLAGLRVVKAFGREDHQHGRFLEQSRETVRGQRELALTRGKFDFLVALTIVTGTATVLFIGVQSVKAGDMTLGSLLLIMSYIAQLYAPLESLTKKVADVQNALVGARRALRLLDEPTDVPERPHAKPLDRCHGDITLENASFGYGGDPAVFRGLDLRIAAGTRVGIAGPTGTGKSTFISLLPRFYDLTGGRILLDGVDIRDYRLADLRSQFAFVLQDSMLFSGTVAENIAYARPEATEDEITAASNAANAHEFVMRLPDGYQTQVGERGMRLSGGERQRIALARAFLKNAPILILDEPTSALDVKTEAQIMQSLHALMRGRTTIMIAHRLSTLDYCDVVYQLKDGQLLPQSGSAKASKELV